MSNMLFVESVLFCYSVFSIYSVHVSLIFGLTRFGNWVINYADWPLFGFYVTSDLKLVWIAVGERSGLVLFHTFSITFTVFFYFVTYRLQPSLLSLNCGFIKHHFSNLK